jgi:NAD(P)H-quinone oxidoreductase subunit I
MRKVTLEYPEKKRFQSDAFRGMPEVKGCVGCGICKRVCPSNAIEYNKNEEGKVISYTIDLKKCIFCGNCMYYCPKGAIKLTEKFELATVYKKELKLNYKGGCDD